MFRLPYVDLTVNPYSQDLGSAPELILKYGASYPTLVTSWLGQRDLTGLDIQPHNMYVHMYLSGISIDIEQ